jgi:hemerythrin superfamily protein
MSEMKTLEKTSAIALLKKDHKTVKALFDEFEKTEDKREKKRIVAEALKELKIHATIEEKMFYPAVRAEIDDEEGIMDEADEEHHVAKVLIAELELMTGNEEHYDAKFTVLAENIRHHIKEEEGDMLPEAAKTDIDMDALGGMMMELKEELQAKGVPPDAEMAMVKKSGLRGDSPAKNAEKSFEAPKK